MIENLIHTLQSLKIRLTIDNGNLKINAPKGTLTPEIIDDIKAHKNELITLLSSSESIPKAENKEYYALTSSQHRLWTLSQFETGNSAYNIFEAFEFKGSLDFEKLTKAFNFLINRHESLRTVFKEDEHGKLGQYIIPVEQYSGALQVVDLNNATNEVVSNYTDTIQKHAFDLAKGPLFIGDIVKVSDDRNILMLNMHHIIGDGWSMGVLSTEFMTIYNGLSTENEVILPELPIQYKDYSEWQNSQARQSVLEKTKAFWLDTFSGEIPILALPSNKTRPKLKTYNGSGLDYLFSKTSTSQLNTYAQQNSVSLFMVLMAGINGLLSRYTNTRDIILGTPVAGRAHSDLENQVGLYLNTLAIRTTFEQEVTFEELLAVQKQTLLNAYSHQEYPFDNLVEDLGIKRDLSRSVLFDALIVFQNQEELLTSEGLTLNNVEVSPYKQLKKSFSKFDLSFIFREKQGQLSLYIEYNTDIYELDFIEKLVSHFDKFLTEAIQNPDQKVAKINYLGFYEESQLLYEFNTTTAGYPDTTMVDLFVNQAIKTPEQIALITDHKSYTYKELDEVSNQLSHYLLSHYNLGIEDLVGVKLDRSEWLLISLLAVLKSGCAYAPIDPNYPAQRIAYIEQDSKCKVTIDQMFITAFTNSEVISTKLPEVSFNSNNLAYIIYTSGSTGKPKGVMITHKNASSMLHWSQREFSDTAFDTLYAVTSHCFDLSVYEFFYPLSIGKQIRLLQNGLSIADYIDADKNVLINTVPSVVHALIDKGVSFENAVGINLAGEAFPVSIANHFRDSGIALRNLYGPSEDTTYSSYYRVEGFYESSVPIGKAIDNTQFYILSDALSVQPVGVIGEICISGEGLSRGYLYQPELTAEKFIAHPFGEKGKLYKTGDLGKWLPDGTIVCIGRKDSQVKIRGYRVELGEIEQVLESQENIDQCVVVVGSVQDEQVIISYIVSAAIIDKQQLRLSLGRELPEYMLPSYYVFLDQLPLTPNGKIDKNGLPPVSTQDIIQLEYLAPVTALEKELVLIWEDLLGLEKIGITDNFFESGGHSLKVTLLVNKINRQLGYEISVKEVFLNPTISGIISQLQRSAFSSIPKAAAQENYVLTSSQHRLWILSQFESGSQAYNIPGSFELEGMLDIDNLTQAFDTVIARHESLRTFFQRNDQGEVRQFIVDASAVDFKIEYFDYSQVDDQDMAVSKRAVESYNYQFDLSQAPLVRLHLIKLSKDKHVLLFNMHHIISDGWSMGILSRELITIYDNLVHAKNSNLPELTIQYKDYASWMKSEQQTSKLKKAQQYWLDVFSGHLPILELPTHKIRPKVKTYAGDSVSYDFSKEASLNFKLFSEKKNASLFMVLMAGINGLLSRYTNTSDIILGTPIAGREHSDLENQIGLYLNTLAIRTTFDQMASFEELLDIQKETLLNAYSHQEYPLDNLAEELGLGRDTSRSALFDVLVVLQNQQDLFGSDNLQIENLKLNPYKGYQRKVSQFDLSFVFSEKQGQLSLHVEYNTDIYEPNFVERLVSHFDTFLTEATQRPDQKVAKINYLGFYEESQLLYEFNTTTAGYPDITMVDLFVNQAIKTPEQIALITDHKNYTYKELDEVSNQLSHYLLSHYNLGIEDLVGVKLNRSEWLLISLLAVLKSGCAYVPIDPNYPAQRIAYIEQDSKCKVTIDQMFITAFTNSEVISTTLPEVSFNSNNLAYIIYTSGSTGKPKGVMITHKNASSMLHWSQREFGDTAFDTLYAVTSHCFDLSVYEFFYPLSIGKQIRLLQNGLSIADYIDRDKNVLINTVPSVVHALIDKGVSFENAVGINLAGEAFPVSIANHFRDSGIALRNLYGPSEDTTYSSYYRVEGFYESSVPIGKAIDNTQFYILSDALAVQPVGVIGEICISGEGLSRGYLYQPELTAEKFIAHPFGEKGKLYKTGDLGKWLPDGTIVCIGRKDSQVKIRGYRVELGEIEQVLESQENIDQCVVVVGSVQDEQVIISYIVSAAIIDKQQLRLSLGRELPEYMLPSYYVFLDQLPLTPNGKIDKNGLPAVSTQDIIQLEYVAPSNEIEEKLVSIWEEVLQKEKIGVEDSFFALGGHSLKAIQVISKIQKEFNFKIELKELYNEPTITNLARYIESIQILNNQQKVSSVIGEELVF
ncbi:amino acid adenylation domain-containing protein [Flavobacterium sp. FlaQc-47]|uniref:amino acid adenylation domain-containing protein n=1 Tax=Flavobacterium sp. FlaQc-47 TaxID=3374180 RepID=UPI0037568980